jgi:hypothetical protein
VAAWADGSGGSVGRSKLESWWWIGGYWRGPDCGVGVGGGRSLLAVVAGLALEVAVGVCARGRLQASRSSGGSALGARLGWRVLAEALGNGWRSSLSGDSGSQQAGDSGLGFGLSWMARPVGSGAGFISVRARAELARAGRARRGGRRRPPGVDRGLAHPGTGTEDCKAPAGPPSAPAPSAAGFRPRMSGAVDPPV